MYLKMNNPFDISFHKWRRIYKEYELAYSSAKDFPPFLSPKFIDITLKHKIFFSESRFKKFLIAKGVFQNGIIYAPLLVDKKSASLIGDYTSASYTGFVYKGIVSKIDIQSFVKKLSEKLQRTIVFEKILPFNSIYDALDLTEKTTCVKVDFNSSFDDYFNSLKKNVRQNYRTVFNRLKRENKEISIKFFFNEKIPRTLKRKLVSLYVERSKHWDKSNKRLINVLHRKYFDLMNNGLDKVDNCFCSVLSIDNCVCGFMMGVLTADMRICTIPRLAVDTTFGVYCPGLVLIVDSIRYLIERGCVCLDLSRGEEQYKFTVGGTTYRLLSGKIVY